MAGKGVPQGSYGKFYASRLVPIHLVYLVTCVVCSLNRLAYCSAEAYQPYQWGSIEACRATKLDWGYGETWLLSIVVMLLCLQAWPIGVYVWHISYYTWFSSAYQFCIFCFPYIHHCCYAFTGAGAGMLYLGNFVVHFAHYVTLVIMESVYLTYRHPN